MYTDPQMQKKEDLLRHILRRHPDDFNLTITPAGWVDLDKLLHNVQANGYSLTINDIHVIMEETKTEYSFNKSRTFIRANYGHSLRLKLSDIVGAPSCPTKKLYHGTTVHNAQQILNVGLFSQTRDHVFLTTDYNKAYEYGKRHGVPVVLEIDTELCTKYNYDLYHACSHIWLAYYIPAECIRYSLTHTD